jgi:hypothetical protein
MSIPHIPSGPASLTLNAGAGCKLHVSCICRLVKSLPWDLSGKQQLGK